MDTLTLEVVVITIVVGKATATTTTGRKGGFAVVEGEVTQGHARFQPGFGMCAVGT